MIDSDVRPGSARIVIVLSFNGQKNATQYRLFSTK